MRVLELRFTDEDLAKAKEHVDMQTTRRPRGKPSPRRDALLPRMRAGWLERLSEGFAQMTAGLAQLLALSPRQRARGQIEHSDAGYVQRGQRCGCALSG